MQSNNRKIIIKKNINTNNTVKSELDFYSMDKGTLRDYSEKIAIEKLAQKGYRLINISNGREKSLFKLSDNNEVYLCRFMFYRFNPKAKSNYVWILKENFNSIEYKYLIFVLYAVNSVHVLLIPANDVVSKFESRDYEGKKSLPEWGVNLNYLVINKFILNYEIN